MSNKYKVPLKTWRRWSKQARALFNEMYSVMWNNQRTFLHPKQDALSRQKWKTVAWNAAWIAADFVAKTPMTHVEFKGKVTKVVRK